MFEVHLILYFACHFMFDAHAHVFLISITPVVVTVVQFCQSTFYFLLLLQVLLEDTFTFYFSNFLDFRACTFT